MGKKVRKARKAEAQGVGAAQDSAAKKEVKEMKVDAKELKAKIEAGEISKRKAVLALREAGWATADIARELGVRYQMVRRYILDAGHESITKGTNDKGYAKELRRLMYEEGMSPYKAAKVVGVPPQYAYALRSRDRKKGIAKA